MARRRKTVEEIDQEIEELRRKRHEAVVARSRQERKARDHALIVLGGMIESCFEEGWQSIDFYRMAEAIQKNRNAFGRMTTDTLPTPEATERLREFQREARSKSANDSKE